MKLDIKSWVEEKMKHINLEGKKLVVVKTTLDPASDVYMKKKVGLVESLGGEAHILDLSHLTPSKQVDRCEQMQADWILEGNTAVIVQFPTNVLMANWVQQKLDPALDIDGLGDRSVASLMRAKRMSDLEQEGIFVPNTALGILEYLLDTIDEESRPDTRVFIAGRSMLVGRPLAQLLDINNIYSFVAHTGTPDWIYWDEFADATHSVWARGLEWSDTELKHIMSNKDFPAHRGFKHTFLDVSIMRDEKGIHGEIPKDLYESEFLQTNDFTSVPGGVGLLTTYALVKQLSKK